MRTLKWLYCLRCKTKVDIWDTADTESIGLDKWNHSWTSSHELVVCQKMETSSLAYNGAAELGNKGVCFNSGHAI
jgi:hypothetical protein